MPANLILSEERTKTTKLFVLRVTKCQKLSDPKQLYSLAIHMGLNGLYENLFIWKFFTKQEPCTSKMI